MSKKCEVSCPGCGRPGMSSTTGDQCALARYEIGTGWVRCSPEMRQKWLDAASKET